MRPPLYRRTLKDDLERWIEKGLVAADKRDAILADIGFFVNKPPIASILAILGAVFMALAALSFVAANWGGFAKIIRFGFILLAMWGAYGLAAYASIRKGKVFVHAFALLGAALFGAAIMLVAQTFNIEAHYPNGILIWCLGAYVTALAVSSRPVLILASLLCAFWMQVSYSGSMPGNSLIWVFPFLWVSLAVHAWRMRGVASLNILMLAGLFFVGNLLIQAVDHELLHRPAALSLFAILALCLTLLGGAARRRRLYGAVVLQDWSGIVLLLIGFFFQFRITRDKAVFMPEPLWWALAGLAAIFLGIFLWRSVGKKHMRSAEALFVIIAAIGLLSVPWLRTAFGETAAQIFYGGMFFAISILAIVRGVSQDQKSLLWLGGAAFVAEALYAYFETFKDLLSTSLFFFFGGVLLLGFALGAMRYARKIGKDAL